MILFTYPIGEGYVFPDSNAFKLWYWNKGYTITAYNEVWSGTSPTYEDAKFIGWWR